MTISNEIILLIVSGVGVVLWWFVVTLIKELKEQGTLSIEKLINLEKDMIIIRERMNNYDERIKALEEIQRERILAHT